ncbi:MAG TPA: HAD family phosphatase [Gemmatimonadaceae bacterium]|nr:HAD family phosphatase [Gemmatimonadaceae bacterium]
MNIIFDLGGVVVRWEPDAIIANVFDDPAVRAVVRQDVIGHQDWLDLDRGTISYEAAIERAAKRTRLPEPEIARFLDRVPPLLTPIPETVSLMRRVKARGHAVYCLSNMPTRSIEYLERTHDFWDVFTGKVISSRVKLCKPDPAIYAHLLKTFSLSPAETAFIDDVRANLDAAEQFGIAVIQFASPGQCEVALRRLGAL